MESQWLASCLYIDAISRVCMSYNIVSVTHAYKS